MKLYLYDNLASVPKDRGSHILVFAGASNGAAGSASRIVTRATCEYFIGDQVVIFQRNADDTLQFEESLGWAARYAEACGIGDIHAVFALNRQIDRRILEECCPEGFIDRRISAPEMTTPGHNRLLRQLERVSA